MATVREVKSETTTDQNPRTTLRDGTSNGPARTGKIGTLRIGKDLIARNQNDRLRSDF